MSLSCVVLAGGLGTRMRPLTETLPKTLVPVAGRPFADRQLEWLHGEGVRHVVYSVGFLGDIIRTHIGDGGAYGLKVDWVDEGTKPMGTGGALRLVADSGLAGDAFFVLYGDSFLRIKLGDVERAYRMSGLPALMTVLRNRDAWDRSNAICSGGRVVVYDKRRSQPLSAEMQWIDYGLSILTAGVIQAAIPQRAVADVADLMHGLSVAGQLASYEADERFFEIGSPQGLADLEAYLRHE